MSAALQLLKQPKDDLDVTTSWDVLFIFTLYRLCLAVLFLLLFNFKSIYHSLGELDPRAYLIVNSFYLLFGVFGLITTQRRLFAYQTQVMLQVMVDIVVLLMLMHCSSLQSGFGILLNAAIAGGSLLIVGNYCYAFASVAVLGVFIEHSLIEGPHWASVSEFIEVCILSLTFFATAMLGQRLAQRIRAGVELAQRRGDDIKRLQRLNNAIIQHMNSGVVVVDKSFKLTHVNDAAKRIFTEGEEQLLPKALPELIREQLNLWVKNPFQHLQPFQLTNESPEYSLTFMPLAYGDESMTLILLDDISRMTQHAQQLKLASLGQLTASIAHEIRNPIAAISHASELLDESWEASEPQHALLKIIHKQTTRVNSIIKNILQLSRNEPSQQTMMSLSRWFDEFIAQLRISQAKEINVEMVLSNDDIQVFADPSQLQQILMNLCLNALHYSYQHAGKSWLKIAVGVLPQQEYPYVDIFDKGPGISAKDQQRIFEPFFTTNRQGTGLGLYIAKELCEMNQAQLVYRDNQEGGCFRIIFKQPVQRVIL